MTLMQKEVWKTSRSLPVASCEAAKWWYMMNSVKKQWHLRSIKKEEFYLISGHSFIDEPLCEKERRSCICLVSAMWMQETKLTIKGNETDRKDNKEGRLSRRHKPFFGVSFVDYQQAIRGNKAAVKPHYTVIYTTSTTASSTSSSHQ